MDQATTVAYLVGNQQNEATQELTNDMLAAARALGRQVIVLECRSVEDFEPAFATLVDAGPARSSLRLSTLLRQSRKDPGAGGALQNSGDIFATPVCPLSGLMSYSAAHDLAK